ncbi:hypothetical protein [Microbacterium caowuchunii]|uniref:Uncharacterized protein n=2 Tax=Microbacterium caowuchunii TaxID=2614638 RepID=A0A5N0TBE6_9MICO|nr:hypothetical protein [Microbacterium caowuchunii]KAA9132322.1 hypothetical protein F6B40_11565 [Microbacterium caowuchunii]
MVQVMLVTESWSKRVEVDAADELIEAEGMSWEREGTHPVLDGPARGAGGDVPRYVPAVSA